MATPTIAATTSSNVNSNSTSHTVSLTAGTSGNLMIVGFACDGATTVDWTGTGFTEILDINDAGNITLSIAYRISDGTEGATISVGTAASERSAHVCYEISSWHGTSAPEVSTGATGNSTTPDPDSVTASWGLDTNLFLVFFAVDRGAGATISAYPSGYTLNQLDSQADNNAGARIGSAGQGISAASDDPGTATISTGDQWCAATVVVRPSAGGGGGRIMSSLAGPGGLAGMGGIAGPGGGLAG